MMRFQGTHAPADGRQACRFSRAASPGVVAVILRSTVSIRIDKLLYDQALAPLVIFPQGLYAVNKHVA